jgi:hypothetical protein
MNIDSNFFALINATVFKCFPQVEPDLASLLHDAEYLKFTLSNAFWCHEQKGPKFAAA